MTIQLVDLSNIVSIVLGSMAGVLAGFQIVRNLFLDRLVKGRLDTTQQNTLYHLLVWLIIAGLIVGQALLHGYAMNLTLIISAGVAAVPIAQGVKLVFDGVQQVKSLTAQGMTMGQSVNLAGLAAPAVASQQQPDPYAPLSLPPVPDAGAPSSDESLTPPEPPEPPARPTAATA